MTAIGLLAVGLGVVLVWSGVKGEDVRTVLAKPFGGGASSAPAPASASPDAPIATPVHTAAVVQTASTILPSATERHTA